MNIEKMLNPTPVERHFRFSLAITCSCHPLCSCPMQTSCWSADLCSNGFAWLASWTIAVTPYYHFIAVGDTTWALLFERTGGDLLGELGQFFQGGMQGPTLC